MEKILPAQKNRIEDINDLSVLFWNCSHGLASKISVLKSFLISNKPNVVFVCESEIKSIDNLNFYFISGYELHTAKTIERGNSRIAAYIMEGLNLKRNTAVEGIMQDVLVFENQSLRIAGLYRPFKLHAGETAAKNFEDFMTTLKKISIVNNKQLICGGDFNVNWLKDSKLKEELLEWTLDSGIRQIVNEVTRYRTVETETGTRDESSLLDHIYVPNTKRGMTVTHYPTAWSDHELLLLKYPIKMWLTHKKKHKLRLRDWRKYQGDLFVKKLAQKLNNQPKNNEELTRDIKTTLDELAPQRVVRIRPEMGETADTRIAKKIKKRDRLIKKYKKSNDKKYLMSARTIGKNIKQLVNTEQKQKIQKKLTSPDPKAFWTLVKSLMGKKSTQEWEIEFEGNISTDHQLIAEQFSKFFLDKVNGLKTVLPDQKRAEPFRSEANITVDEIIKAAKKLKNKKCSGPDGIPLIIIKDIGRYAPWLVLDLLNSFALNGLPRSHKISKVVPLLKKGSSKEMKNYRPISNLNSIGKLFEKVMLSKLEMELGGQEGDHQHAYRDKHSTTTALLELQNSIAKNMEKKLWVATYSMDLSAAFDMLRPEIFDTYLDGCENVSSGLKFSLSDFLTGRGFFVQIDTKNSSTLEMPVGCAQGSILGPKLFTLYLSELRKHIDGDLISYADDSYVVKASNSLDELKEKVKKVSKNHVNYLRSMGMVVNSTKTEIVIFRKGPTLCETFEIDGEQITSRESLKALGITMQSDLKWNKHVHYITTKASQKLSMLSKITKNITKDQFLKLATAQIFSQLYYASQVWLNATLTSDLWKKLKALHYRILRLTQRDYKKKIKHADLDKACRRATPSMWGAYATASLVIKLLRNKTPKMIYNTLLENLYVERRKPCRGRFYNNSTGKVGLHELKNRLNFICDLDFDWLGLDLSDDAIRIKLKKFFNFNFD